VTDELSVLLSLRKVLEGAGEGRGVAESIVRELARAGSPGREVARRVLLGLPVRTSLKPLTDGGPSEVSTIASVIANSGDSSVTWVGKGGTKLSYTLERWVKEKENRRMTRKVMSFRSLISSGVLGGVCSMVATLGPVLGSIGFLTGGEPMGPGFVFAAAAMALVASGMLGLFTSGKRFYQNLAVTAAAFLLVHFLVAPLADIPQVAPWGIK
jgi:hypothetical protein